jgi:hypothetical protein
VHPNLEGAAITHQYGSNAPRKYKNTPDFAGFKGWHGKCKEGIEVHKPQAQMH